MMTLVLPNCCSGIHRKFILLLLSGAIILTGDLPTRNLFTDASLVGENFNRTLPILADLKDASLLSAYVLIRGHIMFGPEDEAVDLDEDVLRKLQTYLFKVKHRQYSPAGSLLHQALKERDIGCDSLPDDTKPLCKIVMEQCLPAERILDMFPVDIQYFHQAFARLCPLMVFRQRAYICLDESEEMENEDEDKRPILVEPEDDKVWAFGILFVTLSIVVSMGGLILLPFLTRENRRTILTLFEGLAVGGLSGSAILHLFPQAFGISDDDYRKYFWRTFLIFAGIYIFYITERILTLMNANNIKGRRRRSSFLDDDLPLQLLNLQASMTSSPTLNVARRYCGNKDSGGDRGDQLEIFPLTGTTSGLRNGIEGRENELLEAIFQRPLVHTNTPKDQIDQKLATLRNPLTMKMISIQDIGCTTGDAASSDTGLDAETESISRSKQVYVNDIAGMRKDHISTTRNLVDAVAWMIVLGDACLNFIDGLSIGAAFDRNILAGISISVAVMLEEVPHRLGTFSVLIRAGMDMRQAFFWIFISACALYPGLALGAFLGDAAEEESPYIFAIAGGMFLYMALVDVMKEMNRTMENAIRKGIRSSLQILALQNLGIVIAVICLSVLAIYEKEMDFIEVEIRELENQALQ